MEPADSILGPQHPVERRTLMAIVAGGLLAMAPLRAIVRLAAPTTLVMLVAAASNVLYTYFVSRLGAEALAAVSLVFPISLLAITAMGGGLGSGVSSAVALAILLGAPAIFSVMGGRGGVLDKATLFARVLFGGAAITFVVSMLDSVLRGEGNVRVPAIWSSTSLTLQMALTPLFMFAGGLGLVVAPLATLTGQLLAGIPRARYVFGGGSVVRLSPRPRAPAWGPAREILRVGVPVSLATTLSQIGIMVLTGVVARLGEAHLAAYGLGTRLDFLLLSFGFGVGTALLTLVGMATGARRPEQVNAYVVRAGAIVVALLAVPGALLAWRPSLWLGPFTSDPGILAVGSQYLRIIGPSYPFMG